MDFFYSDSNTWRGVRPEDQCPDRDIPFTTRASRQKDGRLGLTRPSRVSALPYVARIPAVVAAAGTGAGAGSGAATDDDRILRDFRVFSPSF